MERVEQRTPTYAGVQRRSRWRAMVAMVAWIAVAITMGSAISNRVGSPAPLLVGQAPPGLVRESQRAWDAILASLPHARSCRIIFGFGRLEALVGHTVVGDCLEDEQFDPIWGVAAQPTTKGLLVFQSADGALAFTDGYRTWLLGLSGLQNRLNVDRLCWEVDADPSTCLRA
jgi:hypothetical protein